MGVLSVKIILELVGHANINITLDTYGHLMPRDTTRAMEAVAKQMKNIVV